MKPDKSLRVLTTLALVYFSTGCSNNNTASESMESKTDTMNTATIEKEPKQDITGSAGIIYVNDGGSGDKTPVVFLHSFAGSSRDWENQVAYLRNDRRAITFDMRGHGMSQAPSDNDYSVRSLADDLAAVVDGLGLDRVILVGHSLGGSAAIAYAGKHPEKVAGLMVTGTPGKTPAEMAQSIIASLESDKYDAVMSQYMNKLLANAKPETDRLERAGLSRISKKASLSLIKAAFNYDPLPDLHKYPGPELIVSKASEEQANSLHSSFPTIPYKTVEGTSHWIHLDKPRAFNKIMQEFLDRVDQK